MIIAGFGFRSAATVESLQEALTLALDGQSPDAIASATDKTETSVFTTFAQSLSVPVIGVSADQMTEQDTLTQSSASMRMRQTGSVAEATALAAAGKGATLLGPRVTSSDGVATCALAKGPTS